jgi:hypothetical protein
VGHQSSIKLHDVMCEVIFNIFSRFRVILDACNVLLDLRVSAIRLCLPVCSAASLI